MVYPCHIHFDVVQSADRLVQTGLAPLACKAAHESPIR